jgi:hypothetical protein
MWKPWRRTRAEGGKITPGLKYVPTAGSSDLWWVKVILNVGRPVVAVFVLVMCAPGEHYLARRAGWSEWLAWGMPATLTAYAGIAAVVATKRPKGAPGKKTAVWGAVVSVLLAMAAQPVAHLYGRTGLDGQQITLTIIVSCIPALVFGHLLHMAAAPVVAPGALVFNDEDIPVLRPRSQAVIEDEAVADDDALDYSPDAFQYRAEDAETPPDTEDNASIDYLRGRLNWDGDALRAHAQALINRPPSDYSVPDPAPGMWTAPVGTQPPDNGDTPEEPWSRVPGVTGASLSLVPDVSSVSPSRPNGTRPSTSVTGRVRTALGDNPGLSDEDIRDTFTGEDIRPNTINKAIKRIREENGSQQ